MSSQFADAATTKAACHRRRQWRNLSSSSLLLPLFVFVFSLSAASPSKHFVRAKEPYQNMVPGAHGLLNETTHTKSEATAEFAAKAGASDANAWGWILCYTDAILLPSSTAEAASGIAGVVASAVAANGGATPPPLKIRATSSLFHSTTPFVCPRTYGGGLGSPLPPNYGPLPPPPLTSAVAPTTVALLVDDLRGVAAVDETQQTMTVLAGSRMWQVWKWAAERNLSPPKGVPTTWAELSVGGVVSSSAHGVGGVGRPSSLNDIVLEYTWVDAAGTIRRSARDSPEGQAIAGGLGVLGVVTEVKLQLEALSKTLAVTLTARKDGDLAGDVERLQAAAGAAASTAFLWLPEVGKYNAYVLVDAGNATFLSELTTIALSSSSNHSSDNNSNNNNDNNNENDDIVADLARAVSRALEARAVGPWITGPFPPGAPQLASALVRYLQADANDTRSAAGHLSAAACAGNAATLCLEQWAAAAFGSLPVPLDVGITNYMSANAAPPQSVPWEGGGLAVDVSAIAFSEDDLAQWVADVQKIVARDLGGPARRCAPMSTLLLRFGSETPNTDIAMTSTGLRRPVLMTYNVLRSRHLPDVPSKYSWIQEAVEQLTLCKYSGRPHWGLNFLRTFTKPDCPVRDRYPKFGNLLLQQQLHDPNKVFEPPLFAAVAARSGPVTTAPLCALRKLCYCTTDDQCADGWVCRPGKAFPEYNLCIPAGLKWAV